MFAPDTPVQLLRLRALWNAQISSDPRSDDSSLPELDAAPLNVSWFGERRTLRSPLTLVQAERFGWGQLGFILFQRRAGGLRPGPWEPEQAGRLGSERFREAVELRRGPRYGGAPVVKHGRARRALSYQSPWDGTRSAGTRREAMKRTESTSASCLRKGFRRSDEQTAGFSVTEYKWRL